VASAMHYGLNVEVRLSWGCIVETKHRGLASFPLLIFIEED